MSRLETLAEAIKRYEGWFPLSRSWRHNNPGNLRWSKFQTDNKDNFAVFANYASGWLGLWYDLWIKCSGRSITGLKPTSTIYDLFAVWAPSEDSNDPRAYALWVANFLNVGPTTQLKYFLEDINLK